MPLPRSTSLARAPWRRAALAIVAVAAVATAVLAPAGPARVASVAASTTGTIHSVLANARGTRVAAATPAGNRQRAALPTRSTRGAAARANQALPSATASSASSSSLLRNFNGVGSLDSAKTNYGAQFEPPDQGLCEGNGFVLEAVNSAYTVYTAAGHVVVGAYNVNDLFNEGGYEFTSDPRCFYEASSNRWYTLILFISADGTQSHFDLGVSTSGDPSKFFNFYRVDTTDAGNTANGCPCFGDQPLFGIDQFNVYVSTNEFSISGPNFNGAQIYAIDKTNMLAGAPTTVDQFSAPNIAPGVQAASVQPATSIGDPNAEYFLSSLDPNSTTDNRVGVWAITNRDLNHGQTPVLSSTVITSEPYAFPVPAVQKGSTSPITQNDDRMQQAESIGGSVYAELETALTIGKDSTVRDGAAWFRVKPTLTGNVISGATIQQQGYVSSLGNYVLYPALSADAHGRAAMVFTLTGAGHFPGAAYAVLGKGQTFFSDPIIAAHGTGSYHPKPGVPDRWGDYSYSLLDTVSNTFWLATEYIPPTSSQTTNGQRNWGTRVLEVSVP
jgi:hypothetical protein